MDQSDSTQRVRAIVGNRVEIVSRRKMLTGPPDPDAMPTDNVITLLATGETPAGTGPGGMVEVRGNQGVRITAGPPLPGLLNTTSAGADGVQVIAADTKTVTVQQGCLAPRQITLTDSGIDVSGGVDGTITLETGVPAIGPVLKLDPTSGIALDAGVGALTLQSLQSITLKVAGGAASITLSPEGIVLKGVTIMLN